MQNSTLSSKTVLIITFHNFELVVRKIGKFILIVPKRAHN